MPVPHRHSLHHTHTIVLGSRASAEGNQKNVVKVGHNGYPRGSPSRTSSMHARGSTGPPAQRRVPLTREAVRTVHGGGDLRVAFAVDSYLGRVVARLLVAVLLAQPVYVAFGMELELLNEVAETTNSDSPGPSAESPRTIETGGEVSHGDEASVGMAVPDTNRGGGEQYAEVAPSVAGIVAIDTTESQSIDMDTGHEDGTSPVEGASTLEESYSLDGENRTLSEGSPGTGTSGGVGTDGLVTPLKEVATSTITAVPEEAWSGTSSVASTTDDLPPAQADDLGTTTVHNTSNRYVFGEGECTLVAEGEFYCIAGGPERQVSEDPRVYTERDREGDREIYYFDGVTVRRITNNSYDDFAPVFDEETQRVVWQANIADRMQIMLYDLPTNTTRQVTTGRTNSSNPDIRSSTIVWQEWVDTNWEVMLATVHGVGEEFTIERLTDNAVHDLFPRVYDNVVTWQSERGRSWEIVVYDFATKKRTTLEKREDTKYENPRFALLFDSRHENGDVETIGYALDTGEMMELGTQAKPQPVIPTTPKEEIPDAIPQTPTSLKMKSDGDTVTGGDGGDAPDTASDPSDGAVLDLSTLSGTKDTP